MKIFLVLNFLVFCFATNAQDDSTKNNQSNEVLLTASEKKEVFKEAMIERRDEKLKSQNEFSLGVGAIIKNNIRKNNTKSHHKKDLLITPIPFISFKYQRLELGAGGLSYTYLNEGSLSSKVFIHRMGDHYENPMLQKRHASLSLGVEFKYEKHSINLSRDVQKRSKGAQLEYAYNEFKFLGPKYFLIYGAGIEVLNEKYMQYYYGVTQNEASNSFSAYSPKAALNFRVNSLFITKLTQNISLTTGLGIKYLSSEIQHSPTTKGDAFEFFGLLGLAYKF